MFGRDVVSGETTGKSAMCFSAGHAANEKQGRQQCCENCIKKKTECFFLVFSTLLALKNSIDWELLDMSMCFTLS